MKLREATANDLTELIEFYFRMNTVINIRLNNYNPDNEIYPSEKLIIDSIERKELIIGIEDGIIVLGCIVNHECPDEYFNVKWQVNAERNEFWVLHALRVSPEYEGRGFAKQALSYIVEIAQKRGQRAIRLDVLEGYEVERLYRNFGFNYIDTIDILYNDIGHLKKFRLLEKVI